MSGRPGDALGWPGLSARTASIGLILYWGLFALVPPVTNWDSQVYNLGRLPIAKLGGLFGNTLWTTPRQLMFPWTFDAIHLPLLALGFGYGVPSYLCLLGILAVAWSFLAQRHGRDAGWMGVLALLGLPTLVFQSVITKNDLPVLFGVAVWFHSMRLWREDGRRIHLLFSALAIGFTSGVKTSGLLPAVLCAGGTIWVLRRSRPRWTGFLSATLVSCLLLGSVETYIESYRHYGDPMGPEAFVRDHRNRDGLRGAAANAIRYAMGNIDLGVEVWQSPDRVTPALEGWCRRWLGSIGLGNSGYRSDFNDKLMGFLKNEGDAGSEYGPLGLISLTVLAVAVFWWRPGEDWWRLCLSGGCLFAGICYCVAWMPWNDRFLLGPFAILTVASVCLVYRYFARSRVVITALLGLSLYSAIVYPLVSFNKRPGDLIASLTDRTLQEFGERPSMLPVYEAVHAWQRAHPQGRLYLIAGVDSWVLPFLSLSHPFTRPVGENSLPAALRQGLREHLPRALLVLNRGDFNPAGLPLTRIQGFPGEPGTDLYEVASGGR
jgi:hypothetical protein